MVAPTRAAAPGAMPAGPMNITGAATAPAAAPTSADGQGYQSSDEEKALAKRFKKRIKFFRGKMRGKALRWKQNREYVDGTQEEDGDSGQVRVNLMASVVNTIQPNIYAKAPEVSVTPQERLTQNYPPAVKGFARTLELALNRFAIRDTMLKARGKEAVRSSLTCTTGWVKAVYQRDIREDPLIRNRINDAQENVARLEALLQETQDEAQCSEYEAKVAEIRTLIQAMQKQVDVVHADGLVIDGVKPEMMLIMDESVTTIDEYAQASAIAHGVFMTADSYKELYGAAPPKEATKYNASAQAQADGTEVEDTAAQAATRNPGIDDDDALVLVWEVWSKADQTIFTLCDGVEEFCKAPYQPVTLGTQWYGFFPLQLWRVTSMLYARALVDNLRELVDEYNTRRTNAAEHRRKNLPVRMFNKASSITEDELKQINGRGATTDIIGVTADPQSPLQNLLGSLPGIPYDPAMYDTSDILRDIEMVSGAQDASRGGVNQAKTATEAEIMAMGMQSRTAEQLDTIEDWLTQILVYCAQLLLLNKPADEIKRAFGDEAVWPELPPTKKELLEMVSVTIRAGSTAKPNKMRERDQWLQFLPQLQQALGQIAELRETGNEEMADAMVQVLDETLRRFDERLSIKDFIPGMDGDEPGQEGAPGAGVQRQMKAAQAKLQEMMAEAQKVLDQREQQVKAGEDQLFREQTQLEVQKIGFKADQTVAKGEAANAARAQQLNAKELADDTVRRVTEIVDSYAEKARAAVAAGQPVPEGDGPAMVDDVHAVVGPAVAVLSPPAPVESVPADPLL